ncbi:protein translocase subunit SecD [Xanthomonas graminis]|jgi:preprotein translocase subunit SecD|uniref:Protein translocase subunit SecD n=1 Tax=Xanthomonas graminis pv. graminis TaxID=134874 RepID=A0A1M4L584_9XANT|nr:protein translocase subunit SecD [Xanthomonas translucens]EKU24850.1 Protein-export membrane protein subunit [Xanthomonas translucens pv. graminis ART-Xtg29]OAX61271.1 preprotein translocase subunit SecD [Xanthomonas translucens pv. graminis]UKE55613.1 protein translocase subunit SecD [Xanthomonas translucens pv. graminis]WIH09988.1 protein translocase subunit SecD [Xanthomonas translucens pv. graminis]WIH11277.1 protein translocase subunit SecD [Xanthomonas translucens pv. graminis]
MLEFPRWKYFLILIVLAFSALYALPNVYQKDPSVQITASRGGQLDEALRERVSADLKAAGITPKSVAKEGDSLMVRLPSLQAQTRANDILRQQVGENYTVALNLASTVPQWLSAIGGKPMVLGLDLVGGVHFALQVDQKAALDKRLDAFAEDIRTTLRDNRIAYRSVERRADNSIQVGLGEGADADAARAALAKAQPTLSYAVSGQTIAVSVPDAELKQIAAGAIEQNLTTLRNRVNQLGVAEPIIQRQGEDRIVVELPGVQDTAEAKRMIGATATLEFRGVVEGNAEDAVRTGNIPPEAKVFRLRDSGAPVLLNKRVLVSGDQMVGAVVSNDQNGLPAVSVTLNNVAGQRMFDYTSANTGKLMSVVYIERIPTVSMVDGKEVRSVRVKEEALAPTRIAGVFGKNFQTTGLEKVEAENLAKLLRAGSLAAPMDFVEEYVIGPSLGAENVERGVTAVVYAFLFTLVFFGVYYRMFGAITSVALLMNLLIVVSVMSLFGATMTLPGFAGLALSVGLSVDANVLINERIREELRLGVPPKSAIAAGYEKAGGTILDANLTGLIVGVALYAFGTGPLKGFALTMIIGIFASMFTAITVSRALATLIYSRRKKLKSVAI